MFDRLSNKQVIETIWKTIRFYKETLEEPEKEYQMILGECVNNVLKRSLIKKSEDNVSGVLICFRDLLKEEV